jgi:hypothetical protein
VKRASRVRDTPIAIDTCRPVNRLAGTRFFAPDRLAQTGHNHRCSCALGCGLQRHAHRRGHLKEFQAEAIIPLENGAVPVQWVGPGPFELAMEIGDAGPPRDTLTAAAGTPDRTQTLTSADLRAVLAPILMV